ncbi:lysosome-associated membrane glycoprotein 5 [Caerostris darwini]|uniref:Lysosome-associated membrane glycoprotein 5 n=1 Tax=Caerostris darwini TaxID=1538125 RepID=A0AAV4WLM9_9ARAC|nr:lysosome-associated membrane glycoprotein 5 [Caerostris darwini]
MFLRISHFFGSIILLICILSLIDVTRAEETNESDESNETKKKPSNENIPEEEKDPAKEEHTTETIQESLEKMEEEAISEIVPVIVKNEEKELEEEEKQEKAEEENKEKSEEEEKKEIEEEENKLEEEEKESAEVKEEKGKETEEFSTSKASPSDQNPETTSASATPNTETSTEKGQTPKDTFLVWSSKGKICLLAKFKAVFSISYLSKGGDQKAEITVPKDAYSKGKCDSNDKLPLLQVSWGKYAFTMMFNKTEDNWAVTSMELSYDTSEPLFDGATYVSFLTFYLLLRFLFIEFIYLNTLNQIKAGKKTARSRNVNSFETPLGKSYFCPAQEVVTLYVANKPTVTARIKELRLQPFEVENGQFSPAHRCSKVIIDGLEETPFVQDETVPLAVGCTLALITLFILVGFSVHRAYNAAKVDYNSME